MLQWAQQLGALEIVQPDLERLAQRRFWRHRAMHQAVQRFRGTKGRKSCGSRVACRISTLAGCDEMDELRGRAEMPAHPIQLLIIRVRDELYRLRRSEIAKAKGTSA
jgi:hypothetical protein